MKLMEYQRLVSHEERVTRQREGWREGGREGARCCYCWNHSDFDSVSGDKVSLAPAQLCQESDF